MNLGSTQFLEGFGILILQIEAFPDKKFYDNELQTDHVKSALLMNRNYHFCYV